MQGRPLALEEGEVMSISDMDAGCTLDPRGHHWHYFRQGSNA